MKRHLFPNKIFQLVTQNFSDSIFHFLFLSAVIFFGLIVFRNFFDFSLWGDDWMLMFYTLEHKLAGNASGIFFSAYGGQAILMDLIKNNVGFEPRFYYYASFFLRSFACLSIYFLCFAVTKKKVIAFLAAIFFITSFAGIESTSWVHNSINYLSLALMNFGFILIFQDISSKKFITRKILISYTLFTLAIILAVVRMHGLIFLYPILEASFVFANNSKKRYAILRSIIVVSIFLVLGKLGLFGNLGILATSRVNAGLFDFINRSGENIYKVILFPFGSFLNTLFPLYIFEKNYLAKTILFDIYFNLPEIFLWGLPLFALGMLFYRKVKRGFWLFLIIWVFWLAFLFLVNKGFPNSLGLQGSEVLLGGAVFTLFLNIILAAYCMKAKKTWTTFIFLLSWPFCFLIIPHVLYTSHTTIESFSRYMTLPSGGSQILLAFGLFSILTLNTNRILKGFVYFIVFSISFFIIISNLKGTKYLFDSSTYRFNSRVSSVWASLNKSAAETHDKGRIRIFVFDYDNFEAYQAMIGFGGWYRYAFENGIQDRQKLVIFLGKHETDQIIEAFKDPSYGLRMWGPVIKDNLRLEDIFGFELRGDRVERNDSFIRDRLRRYEI